MADGAILAHHSFVLEYDASPRAIILRHIRPANQIDHLVRLDSASARIHRIRPDAGEIVDLERRDRPVSLDPDPPLAAMAAGVNVGIETFNTVRDQLYQPPHQF